MSLLDKVLSHKELNERPPVLVDIGASGGVHPQWRVIAKYCICIAFDGDDRKFGHEEIQSKDFRKLFRFHSLVSDTDAPESEFYLTTSPFCSSTLEPNNEALSAWSFADKFIVEKKVSVRSMPLTSALQQSGYAYVDWFKSDSQGIDLRLFKSVNEHLRHSILAVEFEPGIIDAYKKEDKLWEILRYMEEQKYWLSEGTTKGSQRLSRKELEMVSGSAFMRKLYAFSHRSSPGWIEMVYLHEFSGERTLRDHLLGWVFAVIQKQYGFALQLSLKGKEQFGDPLFDEMISYSKRKIKTNLISFALLSVVKEKFLKTFNFA
ncbi:MAG: hypothetical protein ACOYNS_14660 [Bacteroidota bacterium]